MSNDTVMIRLQKDTYGRGFNLESVKNPGISLRPGYENDERVVPTTTVAVLLHYIPIKNGSLLIRYPDLVITMYLVSLFGM